MPASSDERLRAIAEGLAACYVARVRKRQHEPRMDEPVKKCLARVATFLEGWFTRADQRHRGLMLIGGVGNGKTTMLQAVADYIGEVYDAGSPYVSRPDLHPCIWKAQAMAAELAHGHDTHFADIRRSRVLMVDDFGAEPTEVVSFGMPLSPMADVLDYRYDNMLPTFISTNLTLTDLFGYTDKDTGRRIAGKYPDTRLLDRAREVFEVVTFEGGSYR